MSKNRTVLWVVLGALAVRTSMAAGAESAAVRGVGSEGAPDGSIISSGATAARSESAMLDGVAAFVNDEAITVNEVMLTAHALLRNSSAFAGLERTAALRAAYEESLQQLISQRLIVQSYQAGDARLPEWIVDKRMAELLDTRFGGDRGDLMRELTEMNLTMSDWRKRVEEQLVVEGMRQSNVNAFVQVGPAQILAAYEARAEQFLQPAASEVSLLLLKAKVGESEGELNKRADAVAARLRAGEDFAEVARGVSDDTSREQGGQLGWLVPEDALREELAKALASMAIGEDRRVDTNTGVYFLRKTGERKAGRRPFEEVRGEIERELAAKESLRLMRVWTERLRAKAQIQTFDFFDK